MPNAACQSLDSGKGAGSFFYINYDIFSVNGAKIDEILFVRADYIVSLIFDCKDINEFLIPSTDES